MALSDDELLQQYVCDGSNPAFTELVHRYVNPVYSAALRQVRSASLAEEITQSVFIDLSKNATRLKSGQPLIAWLYLVTRRTTIDTIRRESRRQVREQSASEIAAVKSNPSLWAQIEPFLDEALETLNEADRQALLLRYGGGKSLREVGENLGTSENAAQKRVSRALEQLRAIFASRGIVITTAGLVTDLSANVVIAAPAGLGVSISAGVFSAVVLTQATHTIVMTALNKALIAISVLLAANLIYQTHRFATGHDQRLGLERKKAALEVQSQQLLEERNHAASLLLKKREELSATHTRANENATVEADLEAWLARVSLLKERLRQMPEKNIPEMRFLNSGDWLSVTLNNTLQTEAKVRLALKELRLKAKLKLEIGPNLQNALRAYSKAHGDRTATDWADLRPYLQPSLGDDILQRYEFLPAAVSAADESVTNKDDRNALQEKAAVDEDYDSLFNFSSRGFGYQYASKFGDQVNQASRAFIKANNGEFPVRFEQLLPYFSTAADETRLKEFWEAGRP